MIKKTRNTFSDGLDQDTAKELVPSNRYFSAKNMGLTKNGEQGHLSTFKGLVELKLPGDVTVNLDNNDFDLHVIQFSSQISSGATLFEDDSVAVTASQNIDNFNELVVELGTTKGYNIYFNGDSIFLYQDDIDSFHNDLTVNTILNNSNYTNLGAKELALDNNKKLIFLFRTDSSDNLYIQVLYYTDLNNDGSNAFIDTDIIFKQSITSGVINSDNIIYNKEGDTRHYFYWCDGTNADKILKFEGISIDPQDHASFSDYIEVMREACFSQSDNDLNQIPLYFFPRPALDIVEPDQDDGNLKPTESILMFYKPFINDKGYNISTISHKVDIPTNGLIATQRDHLRYQPSTNKWKVTFKIDTLPKEFNYIIPYVIHYSTAGEYKLFELPRQLVTNDIKIGYNESYTDSELPQPQISDLFEFSTFDDVSKEMLVYKNRLLKANTKDSLTEALSNFDTRAYRFDSSRESLIYNVRGELENTIDGTQTGDDLVDEFEAVAEDADAINPHNDEYTDFSSWLTDSQYIYQTDGSTIGGEGINISYELTDYQGLDSSDKDPRLIQEELSSYTYSVLDPAVRENGYKFGQEFDRTTYAPNYSNCGPILPYYEEFRGFQGGEVYRFYLILWRGDTPTPGKWIADIKMPENVGIVGTDPNQLTEGLPIEVRKWKIGFTVDTSEFVGKATAISIGMTPRKQEDKTVLGTLPTIGFDYYTDSGTASNYTQNLGTFTGSLLDHQELTDGILFMDYNNLNSNYLDSQTPPSGLESLYDALATEVKVFPIDLLKFGIFPSDFNLDDEEDTYYLKMVGNLLAGTNTTDLFTEDIDSDSDGDRDTRHPDGESLYACYYPDTAITPHADDLQEITQLGLTRENKSSGAGATVTDSVRYQVDAEGDLDVFVGTIAEMNTNSSNDVSFTLRSGDKDQLEAIQNNDLLTIFPGDGIYLTGVFAGVNPPTGGYYVGDIGAVTRSGSAWEVTFNVYESSGPTTQYTLSGLSYLGTALVTILSVGLSWDGADYLVNYDGSVNTGSFTHGNDKSFMTIEDGFNDLTGDLVDEVNTLVSIRRAISPLLQYGGNSYSSRLDNEIQIASYTQLDDTGSMTIEPTGDVYVNYLDIMMDYSKTIGAGTDGSSNYRTINLGSSRGIWFPVESSNNLYGAASESVDAKYIWWRDYPSLDNRFAIFNPLTSGGNQGLVPGLVAAHVNPSLVAPGNTTKIPIPSINSRLTGNTSTKIIASEKKIFNEAVDSWLIFKLNNEKILDPVWEDITKLIDLNNELYVFQKNAVARQYVDRTAQIIDDVSQITLGTGDVLGEHVYMFKNLGVSSNESVVQLKDDVLWQDIARKKIYTLKNGEITGLSELLETDDADSSANRRITYDRMSDLVFIPNNVEYLPSSDIGMIIYDNNLKKFVNNYSFDGDAFNSKYYTGFNHFLVISDRLQIFHKNYDGTFEASTPIAPEVSFIVNPEPSVVKTFDNLFIHFEGMSFDETGNPTDIADYAPASIRVETNYQDTGVVAITSSNIVRKGRYWRYTIPRDTLSGNNDRIRDFWCKVTITFQNTDNIKLTEVITSYRSSNLARG